MDINILCPKCNEVLTDTFSAEKCSIKDGTYQFTMECCKCEIDIGVTLICVYEDTN